MPKKLLIALFPIFCLSARAQVAYYPDLSSQNFDGVRLYDNDSSFGLNLRFRMQNRVGLSFDKDLNLKSSELMVRRLRLRLNGFVYSKKFQYAIQLGFSRGDQDWDNSGVPNIIRDAIVMYRPNKHVMLGIGQTKLPGNRQRVVSSGEQQFVDRSNANAKFTVDRDAGVFSSYENSLGKMIYTFTGAITSGKGRNPSTNNNGFAYTGKLEILPLGAFSMRGHYFEGDWAREKSPKLAIAAAYSYSDNAQRTGVQLGDRLYQERDVTSIFADMIFKYRGWSVMGEYMYRHADNPVTTSGLLSPKYVLNGEAINLQLSYQFKNHIEIAGRFTNVNPQAPVNAYEANQSDYVLGINKYFLFHRLKVQTDFTYFTRYMEIPETQSEGWIWRFQVELGI